MSILKKLGLSIMLVSLLLLGAGAAASFAANPHSIVVTVTNSNSSTPADGALTMNAYIQVRPAEIITLASPSQQYTGGNLLVNLADFSAWAAGEVLVIQLTNTVNQEVGSLNVTITNDDPQLANLQLVAGTGTLIVRSNLQAGSYTITGPAGFNGNLSDGTLSGGYYQKTLSASTSIGSYTVVWGAVAGYFTPANETLNLAKDGSITFTGTYNQIPSYNLTMAVSPAGGGTTVPTTGTSSRLQGTVVNISATPNAGYRWNNWTVNAGVNVDTPASQNTSVTVDVAKTVTANFIKTYTLTVGYTGSGQVSGTTTGVYDVNTPVSLTATPAEHWRFVNWTVNSAVVSTSPTYNTTLDADKGIVALFEPINFVLTVAASPAAGGVVNRDPAGTQVAAGQYQYQEGTQVSLTPVAAVGYQFKEWQGGLTGSNVPGVLTLNANTAVTAVFEQIPYLSINKTEIVFTDTKLTDTLIITNNGQGLLSWAIDVNQNAGSGLKTPMVGWLNVSPLTSGDVPLAAGQSAVVTLTVIQNNSYAELTVRNTTAGINQPDQLVIARINQAPISPDPDGVDFHYLDAAAAPVGEAIDLDTVGVDTPIIITGPSFDDADQNDYQIAREYEIWTTATIPTGVFEPQPFVLDQKVFGESIQGTREWTSFGRNILKPEKTYGLRIRYQDNYSAWSEWTDWILFKTVAAGETLDDQGQGVPSDQFVDLNTVDLEKYPYLAGHDNDETDAKVVLATEAATGDPVPVLVETNTGELVYLRQDDLGAPTASTTAPYGVFTTRVENIAAGAEVTLTFTFPEALPADMLWYKYDETTAGWTPYDEANWDFGPAANQVTVRIKDGDYGDADRVENQVAVDPAGPVTLPSGGALGSYSGGDGGCFIATAAFGSYQERHVWMLRLFRDRFLLASPPGRAFVRFYYRHSPPLAAVIARNETLRAATRTALLPVYGVAWLCLNGRSVLAGLLGSVLLAGLFLLAGRRRFRLAAGVTAVILLLGAVPASALDINNFSPAIGGDSFTLLPASKVLPARNFSADLYLVYVEKPLRGNVGGKWTVLSEDQTLATLGLGLGVTDSFQLGLRLPYLFSQGSQLTGAAAPGDGDIGDLRLEGKYRVRGGPDQVGVALLPYVTLETGEEDSYFGKGSNAFGLTAVLDRNFGDRVCLAFKVGYQYQEKENLPDFDLEDTLLFGAGIGWKLPNDRTRASVELQGLTNASALFNSEDATPVELLGSIHHPVNENLLLDLGLGVGLTDGYGAPEYRLFLGMRTGF